MKSENLELERETLRLKDSNHQLVMKTEKELRRVDN